MRIALAALLLLAACAAPTSNRDQSAPIRSIALFDFANFAGDWHVVARLPDSADSLCQLVGFRVTALTPADFVVSDQCGNESKARITGPGRFAFETLPGQRAEDRWVLWVDDAYSTAVIATPSGDTAQILNRTSDIRSDRLTAAFDVLRFNGFDPSDLVMTSAAR